MKRKYVAIFCVLAIFGLMMSPILVSGPANAATLEEAIAKAAKGEGKGQINMEAEKGYLGIPGGPKLNPFIGLLWAIWVGWIFSTVGAFGGILMEGKNDIKNS